MVRSSAKEALRNWVHNGDARLTGIGAWTDKFDELLEDALHEAHTAGILDSRPVIEAAFRVVEDMRSGLNKSHPRAAEHLAAYDAAIEARRAEIAKTQDPRARLVKAGDIAANE